MTRRSSTIRTTISPTSRKTWSRTLDDSVFPQCLNLLFRKVSHWWFCSSNGKQGKHAIGNPLLERGREEREGFEISGTESMSKKGWRNGICVSLKSHRKFCSQESLKILLCCSRSPRTLGTKSSTSFFFFENSVQRKFLNEYIMESQNLKRRNSEHSLSRATTIAWISKTTIIESQSIGISSSTRDNTFCVAEKKYHRHKAL